MPTYVTLIKWTDQGVRNAKDTVRRAREFRADLERRGGKVVEPFIAKLGLKSVKTYLDPKSAAGQAFKVQGLPTSILVDRDGKVLGRVEGAADWNSPEILGVLETFLNGSQVIKASH